MSQKPSAEVIVTLGRDPTKAAGCVQRLLDHSGPILHRLLLIEDALTDSAMTAALAPLIKSDPRVEVVRNLAVPGEVGSCNRGLGIRQSDAVLLQSDVMVGPGWLTELAAVAHAEERTACTSPLINGTGACSISLIEIEPIAGVEAAIRDACPHLPRWTVAPVVNESCIYLRGDVVDSVGPLDTRFTSLGMALNDWLARASSLGFEAKRANHVFVHRADHPGPSRCNDIAHQNGEPAGLSHTSHLTRQIDRFNSSLDCRLACHMARVTLTGKLRAALDIRNLPPEEVGTRTYTVSLARALGQLPEIDLTLLVRDPAQARGLSGRVVTQEQWADDVEVIHRPAQVLDPRELRLLFESSAHVVISYLDLIGYRIPVSFPTNAAYDNYRATTSLTLPAAQRIIAISESARGEISVEFGIPRDDISVVHLGVEPALFSQKLEGDNEIWRALRLYEPYFFSIATDFPHKNLANLLQAYANLRNRWHDGEPPDLVLAGHTSSSRTGFYPMLESDGLPDGVTFLGPVSRHQLRVLYQRALALVFPSLYEGFGLPPLEAMAAETPVIAMPVSAVPEVCGDAILYADDLSISALARAMELIAKDPGLRDDLRARGRTRVEGFQWERTARATIEVYRAAVLRPSHRALHSRRMLRDAIVRWSEPRAPEAQLASTDGSDLVNLAQPVGIRNAFKVLDVSLRARLRRELRRLQPGSRRRSSRKNRPRV